MGGDEALNSKLVDCVYVCVCVLVLEGLVDLHRSLQL